MSEVGADGIGGIFTSLASAMTYARDELRGEPSARIVVDLDGTAR
jgi:hypothetical protein